MAIPELVLIVNVVEKKYIVKGYSDKKKKLNSINESENIILEFFAKSKNVCSSNKCYIV